MSSFELQGQDEIEAYETIAMQQVAITKFCALGSGCLSSPLHVASPFSVLRSAFTFNTPYNSVQVTSVVTDTDDSRNNPPRTLPIRFQQRCCHGLGIDRRLLCTSKLCLAQVFILMFLGCDFGLFRDDLLHKDKGI